ncbi:PIG-L deacetylase family protein [Janibacter sp. G56]|uniref:PIG-L deacetylase family protein n=1 Tax=Janibacter sp. G56 TaxID=3418717 RepID=UPI003D023B9A
MPTVVFVHAHPDDEASQTAGTMALLARQGHRVVNVIATNGDHGAALAGLADGETVADVRRREAIASAEVIGIHRVAWLGYADSGMTGWEQNHHPGAFMGADLDEAAHRLRAVLDDEDADVLIGYDWHGGYGHPDHIKVHHVVHRAADLAARRPRVLESSMNRDHVRRGWEASRAQAAEMGMDPDAMNDFDPDRPMDDGNPLGQPETELHHRVDVRELIEVKRAALAAHASQSDAAGMLQIPIDFFREGFGWEFYAEPGREPGLTDGLPI